MRWREQLEGLIWNENTDLGDERISSQILEKRKFKEGSNTFEISQSFAYKPCIHAAQIMARGSKWGQKLIGFERSLTGLLIWRISHYPC